MNPDLEKQLLTKYPKIFAQKDLPMTETCMCWGIDCGDGWYKIIDALCLSIQNYVDSQIHMNELIEKSQKNFQVEAVQVKEKFGGLRFYISGGDDRVDGMILLAETLSFMTCEHCGKDAKLRGDGWLFTLCEECNEKRKSGKTENTL